MQEPILKDMQVFDDNERKFTGWASVEMVDKAGELIPISEIGKVMDTWMERGAPMTDSHSNRVVGKGLNWQFMEKDVEGKKVPGILVTGMVYNKYATDKMVWDNIKSGKYTGLSFGGANHEKTYRLIGNKPVPVLESLEMHELAMVETPCNPEATFQDINMMAKSAPLTEQRVHDIVKEYIQKPFAGYKDFEACTSANSDKENAKAYCASIMNRVEGTKKDIDGDELKRKPEAYYIDKEMAMPKEETKQEVQKIETVKESPVAQENPMDVLKSILETQNAILAALKQYSSQTPKQETPSQPAKTEKEDAGSVKLPKSEADDQEAKGPGVTEGVDSKGGVEFLEKLSKMETGLMELKKSMGIKKTSTPRPYAGVQKSEDVDPTGLDAILNAKTFDQVPKLSTIAKKMELDRQHALEALMN